MLGAFAAGEKTVAVHMQNPVHIDFVAADVRRLIIYDWRHAIYPAQTNRGCNRKLQLQNGQSLLTSAATYLIRPPPPRHGELFTAAETTRRFWQNHRDKGCPTFGTYICSVGPMARFVSATGRTLQQKSAK
jgi:hypothetical protein